MTRTIGIASALSLLLVTGTTTAAMTGSTALDAFHAQLVEIRDDLDEAGVTTKLERKRRAAVTRSIALVDKLSPDVSRLAIRKRIDPASPLLFRSAVVARNVTKKLAKAFAGDKRMEALLLGTTIQVIREIEVKALGLRGVVEALEGRLSPKKGAKLLGTLDQALTAVAAAREHAVVGAALVEAAGKTARTPAATEIEAALKELRPATRPILKATKTLGKLVEEPGLLPPPSAPPLAPVETAWVEILVVNDDSLSFRQDSTRGMFEFVEAQLNDAFDSATVAHEMGHNFVIDVRRPASLPAAGEYEADGEPDAPARIRRADSLLARLAQALGVDPAVLLVPDRGTVTIEELSATTGRVRGSATIESAGLVQPILTVHFSLVRAGFPKEPEK